MDIKLTTILGLLLAGFQVFMYFYTKKYPNSRLSQLALRTNGPEPIIGERRAQYHLRWANFSLAWFIFLLLLWSIIAWWFGSEAIMNRHPIVIALTVFMLPLGMMMALTAWLWFLIRFLWDLKFNSDLIFLPKEEK